MSAASILGRPEPEDIVEVYGPWGEYLGYATQDGVLPDTTNPHDVVTWEELEQPGMGWRVIMRADEYRQRMEAYYFD